MSEWVGRHSEFREMQAGRSWGWDWEAHLPWDSRLETQPYGHRWKADKLQQTEGGNTSLKAGLADKAAPIPERNIRLSDHRPTGAVEEAVPCCCWGLWGRGALSEHLPHPLVQPDMLSTLQFWTPKPSTARNRAGTPHIPGSNKCILCCLNITSEPPPQACGAGVRPEGDGAKWK